MGMYSSVDYEEVRFVSKKAGEELHRIWKTFQDYDNQQKDLVNNSRDSNKILAAYKDKGFPEWHDTMLISPKTPKSESWEISLEGLDSCKIIGYWYDTFLLFCKEIAPYIEGYVELSYEERGYGANLIFKDGEVKITIIEPHETLSHIDDFLVRENEHFIGTSMKRGMSKKAIEEENKRLASLHVVLTE